MSVEVFLRKDPGGVLVPDDLLSRERLDKIKNGSVVRTELTKPRNYTFLKKFMAMLTVAFENQEQFGDFETFRYEVTVLAGYYTEHQHLDGTITKRAKSISFAGMDEIEFGEVYASVWHVLLRQVLKCNEAEGAMFQAAIDEIVGFA